MTGKTTVADAIRDVVLVHGLWYGGPVMSALAQRLERAGFSVRRFNYRTTGVPLERSARRLQLLCERSYPDGVHLVGHSLGGLLILQMLVASGWSAPGRVLFLGTPLTGSALARRASNWPGASLLLGHSSDTLQKGQSRWPEHREIGMIAGTQPVGLGLITGGLERPNDGTVSVAETCHGGISERRELPVSHTGMLFSRQAARETVCFLSHGHFRKSPKSS